MIVGHVSHRSIQDVSPVFEESSSGTHIEQFALANAPLRKTLQ